MRNYNKRHFSAPVTVTTTDSSTKSGRANKGMTYTLRLTRRMKTTGVRGGGECGREGGGGRSREGGEEKRGGEECNRERERDIIGREGGMERMERGRERKGGREGGEGEGGRDEERGREGEDWREGERDGLTERCIIIVMYHFNRGSMHFILI